MPGIAGIIRASPCAGCHGVVKNMVTALTRGATVSDFISQPELGIYLGVATPANKPSAIRVLSDDCLDLHMVILGDILDEPEICRDLRRSGYELSTCANWPLYLYAKEGPGFLAKISGSFAGFIIDSKARRGFLFSDRYGLDRIYLHHAKDAVYFSSEAKAILRVIPDCRSFDSQGVSDFLAFGCTLNWRTLFRNVGVLPAGSILTIREGGVHQTTYFDAQNLASQTPLEEREFEEQFYQQLKCILPRYFISAHPVGVSLTAGLDTRLVMAFRPASAQPALCYTFVGERGQTLDAKYSRQIAYECGLEHRLIRIDSDFFLDFASHADTTVYTTDGCFGVTGSHEIYLNERASETAPVRLTGVFGSEVLRGVSTFKPLNLNQEILEHRWKVAVQQSIADFSRVSSQSSFTISCEVPWSIHGSIAACKSRVLFRTPYLARELVELAFRAPKRLRNQSSVAVNVIRRASPELWRIPTDRGYAGDGLPLINFFRRGVSAATFKMDYFYNEGMPSWLGPLDPLLSRLNSGLGVLGQHKYLHYRRWFRTRLAQYAQDVISRRPVRDLGFFNTQRLDQVCADHVSGRGNLIAELNAIITLEIVDRLLIRRTAT